IVATLHVAAEDQATFTDLAAPRSGDAFFPLAVVEAQTAEAHVAAVHTKAIAQHDVQRACHGVAGAARTGRTHDFDTLDQLGRNAVHEEGAVGVLAGHLLAVDQDLRVARIETTHAHAVGL